jgi:hypothetical protein
MAELASPWKYKISEKMRERKAAIKSNLSAIVNFLNIVLINLNTLIL